MTKEPTNIHEAIIAVMRDVGYVQKTKTKGLNYSFAGEAALIAAIRPVMLDNNITLHARYPKVEFGEWVTAKGYKMNTARVEGMFTFTHATSQTAIEVEAVGEGMDTGDKAIYKAQTGAFKYALRQTFIIETGDDPDKERQEETATPTEKKPKKPVTVTENIAAAQSIDQEFYKFLEDTWIGAGVIPPDSHSKHVVGLFNLSPFDQDVDFGPLARWGQIYRGYRDADKPAREAAQLATALFTKEQDQLFNDE